MKRAEKNLQSRRKILDGALLEFGARGYGLGSVTTICKAEGVSKGNLYHHFQDKDDLYLACVAECFDSLTEYLKETVRLKGEDVREDLEAYFDARIAFFEENPRYLRLFGEAAVSPPESLAERIREKKEAFDAYNISVLTGLLEEVTLRPDITLPQVVEVFRLYQDFINAHVPMDPADRDSLQRREEICKRSVGVLLYGVMERRERIHE